MDPPRLFKFAWWAITIASIFQFQAVQVVLSVRKSIQPSYPCLSDLWAAGNIALVLIGLRYVWFRIASPVARKLVDSEKHGYDVWTMRRHQFCANSFKVVYFATLVPFAFFTLRQQSWFSESLDWRSVVTNVSSEFWNDYPFHPADPALRSYYFVNFGYHLCIATCLVCETPPSDFWANALQLNLAIVLMLSSYLANHIRLGCLLMFIHDVCDISINTATTFALTKYKSITFTASIVTMASWVFFRVWSFVRLILVPIMQQLQTMYFDYTPSVLSAKMTAARIVTETATLAGRDPQEALAEAQTAIDSLGVMQLLAGWFGFSAFLLLLLLLNIYWFCLMTRSSITYMRHGFTGLDCADDEAPHANLVEMKKAV